MNASLVYDGGPSVLIPESMGSPLPTQMIGLPLENLGELASRICYGSLGLDPANKPRGRSAAKLHEHILEVFNHSVYEHSNFTVCFPSLTLAEVVLACANRKGVWVEAGVAPEVTTNMRAVIEWDRHTRGANAASLSVLSVGASLRHHLDDLAPMIAAHLPRSATRPLATKLKTDDLTDDQAWVSLYLYGSRGFTHEQVRHRFAMSQRSTRYVDETASPYITHPLVSMYLADPAMYLADRATILNLIEGSISADRNTYMALVGTLQSYNVSRGLDPATARKQARGAARGYLGNALSSEMIFSAPVSGWKWILSQRKSRFADAEIREVYTPGLAALKSSRYGDRFADYRTVPSPDGIGTVLS